MLDGLIGYKLGMTQVYSEAGDMIPVTLVALGPCKVVQIKTTEREGYSSVQLSFDEVKPDRVVKPLSGHYKKSGLAPARVLKEFRSNADDLSLGQVVTADIFQKGEYVDVMGTSRGKGFQGVMKRHNFRGGPETHGSTFHRAPGSIGASSNPSHVFKNMGMPGQMGSKRITTQNLEIVEVRPDQNLVMIKGAIPGGTKGIVVVRRAVKRPAVKHQKDEK